jgi:3-deoxy-7-phosphoheptulonate synthase/chorismate mutase
MERIRRLRGRIDDIDLKLVRLLERRVATAGEIGLLKDEMGMRRHDPAREREVVKNVAEKTGLKKRFVKKIFSCIMEYCRKGDSE